MHNRFTSEQGPSSLYPSPHVVIDSFDWIGTEDYLTGATVRASIAYIEGEGAVAMFIGNQPGYLILSEDFLIDLFNRCKTQLDVRQNPGLSLIGSNPVTLDAISGKRVEAGLVFIGDEILFAITVDHDVEEPILVTPKFLGGMLKLVMR